MIYQVKFTPGSHLFVFTEEALQEIADQININGNIPSRMDIGGPWIGIVKNAHVEDGQIVCEIHTDYDLAFDVSDVSAVSFEPGA